MHLLDQAKKFLEEHWDQKSPLLLGYSGGPDSRVLLDLLLQLDVRPHLAHVDHGWREESALEAEQIKKEAEALNLPFHTIRLEPDRRESIAREKRLLFFSSLFEKIPFQALLLAHHADDRAETALKRTLEGAHLAYLSGLREVSFLKNMPIWRPLLNSCRSDILAYVKQKKMQTLQDPTNLDPSYLRARMRIKMLPSLSETFGKEVSRNLMVLATRSCELKDYLDRKTQIALSQVKKGPWGTVLPPCLEEPIEIRHALQRLGIDSSRQELGELVDALVKKLPNRRFGRRFLADRGYFFHLIDNFPLPIEPLILREGVFCSGNWQIEIMSASTDFAPGSWLNLFLGDISFQIPRGDHCLQMPPEASSSLRKRLQQQKIPAFLRSYVPCIGLSSGSLINLFDHPQSQGYQVRFSVHPTTFGLE